MAEATPKPVTTASKGSLVDGKLADIADNLINGSEVREVLFRKLSADMLFHEGNELEPHHRIDSQIGERGTVADVGGVDIQQDAQALPKTIRKDVQRNLLCAKVSGASPLGDEAGRSDTRKNLCTTKMTSGSIHTSLRPVKVKNGQRIMSFGVSEKQAGGTFQLTEGEVWGRLPRSELLWSL